jgi:F-type H+-transporting ATPase subunit b
MRTALRSLAVLATLLPAALRAQEHGAAAAEGPSLVSPQVGLMLWTLVIFIGLLIILGRFAFPKLLGAVEARERALQEAIDAAKRDREEAARVLEEHRKQIEAARGEAQQIIVEGRNAGEQMRAQLLEQARAEQHEMLERARREIGMEKDRAVAELRREAVELAVRGASRVIERNLDDETNRKIVESYLASIDAEDVRK